MTNHPKLIAITDLDIESEVIERIGIYCRNYIEDAVETLITRSVEFPTNVDDEEQMTFIQDHMQEIQKLVLSSLKDMIG